LFKFEEMLIIDTFRFAEDAAIEEFRLPETESKLLPSDVIPTLR
jgi:hypothetical protein